MASRVGELLEEADNKKLLKEWFGGAEEFAKLQRHLLEREQRKGARV